METKQVYKAIVAVQSDLAKGGIAKDKTCTQGASYKFRGIDDIYNALSPFLSAHGLCILPRMISRQCVERTSAKGNALFYTTVEAEFDFVSAEDGSMHTARTFGEAMDSGDKGTNKAMSAAYKYAAFQAFCIPTEGDNDTENQTHEVKSGNGASRSTSPPPSGKGKPPYPNPPNITTGCAQGPANANPDALFDWLQTSLDNWVKTKGSAGMPAWKEDNRHNASKMPQTHRDKLTKYYNELLQSTKEQEAKSPPTWLCPMGGQKAAEDCQACDRVKDCEVAKAARVK